MVGDLKYGRTVHSQACYVSFLLTFHFVAPDELENAHRKHKLFRNKIIPTSNELFPKRINNQADILYMTRVQRERFNRPHGHG